MFPQQCCQSLLQADTFKFPKFLLYDSSPLYLNQTSHMAAFALETTNSASAGWALALWWCLFHKVKKKNVSSGPGTQQYKDSDEVVCTEETEDRRQMGLMSYVWVLRIMDGHRRTTGNHDCAKPTDSELRRTAFKHNVNIYFAILCINTDVDKFSYG